MLDSTGCPTYKFSQDVQFTVLVSFSHGVVVGGPPCRNTNMTNHLAKQRLARFPVDAPEMTLGIFLRRVGRAHHSFYAKIVQILSNPINIQYEREVDADCQIWYANLNNAATESCLERHGIGP